MALDAALRPRKLHCPTDPASGPKKPQIRPSKTRNRGGTAGSRFQNQRRNPRFGLGSPKLSWAGLGCARWRELGRLGWADLNAAAGRPDTGQTRTENEQNEETPQLDVRVCRPAAGRAGLGWAPKQRNAAARRPQTGQKRTKNGAVSRPKMGPLNLVRKAFGRGPRSRCQTLQASCWQGRLGLGSKTAKRSGTAAPNGPKTHQKRSRLAAENGTSESGKKSLWQRAGLNWPGLGWPGLGLTWAGLKASGCALRQSRPTPQNGDAAAGRPDTGQTRTENEQNEESPGVDVRVCRPAAGRAGLGWAPKQRNAAARRPQSGQKRTKNGAVSRPKMGPLNPVRKAFGRGPG